MTAGLSTHTRAVLTKVQAAVVRFELPAVHWFLCQESEVFLPEDEGGIVRSAREVQSLDKQHFELVPTAIQTYTCSRLPGHQRPVPFVNEATVFTMMKIASMLVVAAATAVSARAPIFAQEWYVFPPQFSYFCSNVLFVLTNSALFGGLPSGRDAVHFIRCTPLFFLQDLCRDATRGYQPRWTTWP